jgi:hypothetical protein
MEVQELKLKLKQEIQQYKRAKETYQRLAQKVAILRKIKINTRETAILLGVKPRTVRKYHEDKFLTGFKYSKAGMLHFFVTEVEAFKEAKSKNWDALD